MRGSWRQAPSGAEQGLYLIVEAGAGFCVEIAQVVVESIANLVLQRDAGYLTEYSLSVDNLFVFVMTAFKVPVEQQHRVLLIGIVLALVLRGLFIAAGAALISSFSWMFYLFGALLIYLGYRQFRQLKSVRGPGEHGLSGFSAPP